MDQPANNIISQFIKLAEASITAEEWLQWWSENESVVKQSLSPGWFLKIKPKPGNGPENAAWVSQAQARQYLASIGQSFSSDNGDAYKEKVMAQIEAIATQQDPYSQNKFEGLKQHFPALHKAIKKHFSIGDSISNKPIDPTTPQTAWLTPDMLLFFQQVDSLQMEGLDLSFGEIEQKDEQYIKLGELWWHNDGDEILIQPGKDEVFYYYTSDNKVKVFAASFREFIEKKLVKYLSMLD